MDDQGGEAGDAEIGEEEGIGIDKARVSDAEGVAEEGLGEIGALVDQLFEGGEGGCVRVYVDGESLPVRDREEHHRFVTFRDPKIK